MESHRYLPEKDKSWFRELTLQDWFDSEVEEHVESWLLNGSDFLKEKKMEFLSSYRHDLFLKFITDTMNYPLVDDVSAGLALKDLTIPVTPDAYNPANRTWADVTVSTTPDLAANTKYDHYKQLLFYESQREGGFERDSVPTLNIFVYDVNNNNVWIYSAYLDMDENHVYKNDPVAFDDLPEDLIEAMKKISHLLFKHFLLVKESIDFEEAELKAACPTYPLLEEAVELNAAYKDTLKIFLEKGSYDSTPDQKNEMKDFNNEFLEKWEEIQSLKIERKILPKSPFKPVLMSDIKESYESIEKDLDKKYKIIMRAKPSCHGLPVLSSIMLSEKLGNTKESAINMLYLDLMKQSTVKGSEKMGPLFSELLGLMADRIVVYDGQKKSLNNKHLYAKLSNEDRKKYANNTKELWARGCLRYTSKSKLQDYMGVGKIDQHSDLKVESVDFSNESIFEPLKTEIRRKVLHRVPMQYNIHRDHKPKVDSILNIYDDFIHSELFQEICCNAKMAENILISCAQAKSGGHIVNSGSSGYFAIVGDNPGLLSAGSTVPLIYVSKNPSRGKLWFQTKERCGEWYMSYADRLNKARLESLADSARLASVLASITLTTMQGTREEKLTAAGILACVAVSVNIRDSGLLDHIRYVIPNIFSEQSDAAGYIKDKLGDALKTDLQGLIYQEIKKCVFSSMNSKREDSEVSIEGGEVIEGGSRQIIDFLGCKVENLFYLNGLVYSAYFACKKGLHVPELECKLMLETITKFESKSKGMTLTEASTTEGHQHFFDGEIIAHGTYDCCLRDNDEDTWRKYFLQMDSFKPCYMLKTFTSMRSSLKDVTEIDPVTHFLKMQRDEGVETSNQKIRKPSGKQIDKLQRQKDLFKEFLSDDRTRVVDQFFDKNQSVWDMAIDCYEELVSPDRKKHSQLYATWDLKRQRSDRDREIYILNTLYKCLAHCVEMTAKVLCDHNDNEQITSPGDTKTLNLKQESINFFKSLRENKEGNPDKLFDQIRATLDMTKWAPGDNLSKFFFLIAGLPYLKYSEKIMMINFLCLMTRKKIILNKYTKSALASLSVNHGIETNTGTWCDIMEHTTYTDKGTEFVEQFESTALPVKYSWLMGVLNYASSAVHAVSVYLVERVLKKYYGDLLKYYKPAVHSDDASGDLIVQIDEKKRSAWEVYPEILQHCLNLCCIKISTKKSYLHKTRKEFVSELNMNGLNYSYWQKQALACITGFSYIDYYKDLSDACSKINSLVSLGGPPSVVNICFSNAISLAKETYGMAANQQNHFKNFLPKIPENEVPVELGGSIDMNPFLLPIVGLKYQNFRHMMNKIIQMNKQKTIEDITEDQLENMKNIPADLVSRAWVATAELSAEEDVNLNPFDGSLLTFRQFGSRKKIQKYRMYNLLERYSDEEIREKTEQDPSLMLRSARSFEEKTIQLAGLLRKKRYVNALAMNSPDQLKLDRILNRYNACCQPSFGEKLLSQKEKEEKESKNKLSMFMEEGLMTVKDATIDVVNRMLRLNLSFYDVYLMLKSLPLYCYVFNIENQVSFEKAPGKKKLYAVRRYKAVTEEAVHTNPGNLLGIYFNEDFETDNVNYQYLKKDLEVIEKYDNIFKMMDAPERAVAINKMIQFPVSMSSLIYVPRPGWTGYRVIIGLMCNSFFDNFNAFPNRIIAPYKNETKYNPFKKQEDSLQQQLSDVAFVMKNIFIEDEIVRRYLSSVTIDGYSCEEILRDKKNFRSSLYARIIMDQRFMKRRDPNDWELIFLKAQKKVQTRIVKYTGAFQVAMVCPDWVTKDHRRIVFFEGENESIHKISYNGDASMYSDLKNILNHFMEGMKWKGTIRSHMLYKQLVLPDSLAIYYKTFGTHSNIRLARLNFDERTLNLRLDYQDGALFKSELSNIWRIEGVPFERLPTLMPIPVFLYKKITNAGLITVVNWGPWSNTREINHLIRSDPNFLMANEVNNIFHVRELTYDLWEAIRNRSNFEIMYSTAILETFFTGPLDLDLKEIQDINISYGHKWSGSKQYSYLDKGRFDGFYSCINKSLLTWPFNPDQESFNMNLSSALLTDPKKARIYSFMADEAVKRKFSCLSVGQMYEAIYTIPSNRFYKNKIEGKAITLFIDENQKEMFDNYYSTVIDKNVNLLERQEKFKDLEESMRQKDITIEEQKIDDLSNFVYNPIGEKWGDIELPVYETDEEEERLQDEMMKKFVSERDIWDAREKELHKLRQMRFKYKSGKSQSSTDKSKTTTSSEYYETNEDLTNKASSKELDDSKLKELGYETGSDISFNSTESNFREVETVIKKRFKPKNQNSETWKGKEKAQNLDDYETGSDISFDSLISRSSSNSVSSTGSKFSEKSIKEQRKIKIRKPSSKRIEKNHENVREAQTEIPLTSRPRGMKMLITDDYLPGGVIVNNQTFKTWFKEEPASLEIKLLKKLKHNGTCSVQAVNYFINDMTLSNRAMYQAKPDYNPDRNEQWPEIADIITSMSLLDQDVIIFGGNQLMANFEFDGIIEGTSVGIVTDGTFTDIVAITMRWEVKEEGNWWEGQGALDDDDYEDY